jgi:hypothetical protein
MIDYVIFIIQAILEGLFSTAKNLKELIKKLIGSFFVLEILSIVFLKDVNQFIIGNMIIFGVFMVIFVGGYFYYKKF